MTSTHKKAYHILATGFEPFGNPMPKDNPSWESLKLLEKVIEFEDKIFYVHASEIPVEYKPVEDIIPLLHRENKFDFVMHIGQGGSSSIQFETCAVAGDYFKLDNKKQTPANNLAPKKYLPTSGDAKSFVLKPELDFQALRQKVEVRSGFKKIGLSNSAGRYLCEYTYFCSLGEALLIKKKDPTDKRKPIFVHVPRPDKEISLDAISKVLKAIIISLPEV
ncbi:Pyroglutamyl-peptidase 1 [Entomophthora muscae]|uniref:Pyroglutamyl-peptidase 1 n=1 Tax=Entomophthora muscae TaxID=34485 RepID=A0ACC2UBK3_9FUNG|nr:Pyroglutamyl-peptidase 1 [Entomophthora muscae]